MTIDGSSDRVTLVCGALGKSGLAAVRLLLALGRRVALSDRSGSELPDDLAMALKRGELLDWRSDPAPALPATGRWSDLAALITAPGVPLALPFFEAARRAGVTIDGENDFGFLELRRELERREQPFVIVAITGTDGKSTTTAMVESILSALGVRSLACGNFGLPLSQIALDLRAWRRSGIDAGSEVSKAPEVLVVECSSFQLEPLRDFHADVALLLNLAEDHLDRYNSLDDYREAKLNLLRTMGPGDLFIVEESLQAAAQSRRRREGGGVAIEVLPDADAELCFSGEPIATGRELPLAGRHNRQNYAAAMRIVEATLARLGRQASSAAVESALFAFRGLSHRVEEVARFDRFRFINDSKATTVQAVRAALSGYPRDTIYLLLGGRGKGASFRPLEGQIAAAQIYPYGEAAEPIRADLKLERAGFADLETAFAAAWSDLRRRGEGVLLLSPGCASHDAYRSYLERGEHFRRLAQAALALQTKGEVAVQPEVEDVV